MEKETEQKAVKILHVFGRLDMGGAENMVINLFRHIDKNVVWFDFVEHTQEHCYFDDEILDSGSKIFRCPEFNVRNIFAYRKWWKYFLLSHPEYRIIHSHVRSTASIYLPIAKRMGRKTIIHSHSTSNGRGFKAAVKKVLQLPLRVQADYYFACSQKAGEWLFGEKICGSEKFQVIPNGIEVEKFKYDPEIRKEVRRELGIGEEFVLGFLARVTGAKNPMFVIDVFSELLQSKQEAKLLFVGSGECLSAAKKRAQERKVAERIIFTGERHDAERLFQAMDIYILPSLWEGLGISLIEAQASGVRCICSENIPSEAIITDLVDVVSLKRGEKFWAEQIIKEQKYKRSNPIEVIRNASYDVVECAEKMGAFYGTL